ncbi:liprin-beta 1 isoform X4 [Tachypleus tridentatus]|uniref:liprin-beta 1 isoform X4 n=1 Tax=Tachypleus tridentatus TaxID=6853 RepID=UPI003FCF619D
MWNPQTHRVAGEGLCVRRQKNTLSLSVPDDTVGECIEDDDEDDVPTPVNDITLASDEFEWVRTSPLMMTVGEQRNTDYSSGDPVQSSSSKHRPRPDIDHRSPNSCSLQRQNRPPHRKSYVGTSGSKPNDLSVSFHSSHRLPQLSCHYCSQGSFQFPPHNRTPQGWCCSPSPYYHCYHGGLPHGAELAPYVNDHWQPNYFHLHSYYPHLHPSHCPPSSPMQKGHERVRSRNRESKRRPTSVPGLISEPAILSSYMTYPTIRHVCDKSLGYPYNDSPCCRFEEAHCFSHWQSEFQPSSQNEEIEELHERIHRLEMEKENLMMQVSVLTDQVEAQTDKLRELEADIEEKKEQIDNTEEMLQQELLTRSSLESSKFDLITEVSNLRLKLSTVEQEKQDCDEAFKKAENQLIMIQARLAEKEAEMVSLQSRLSCNGTVTPSVDCDSELDKLKKALQSVITANDEKEKKIEELKSSLSRYRLLHDVATTQVKKDVLAHQDGKQLDKMSPHDPLLSLSSLAENGKLEPRVTDKPPPVPRSATSPGGSDPHSSPLAWRDGHHGSSPSPVYCQITPSVEKSSPTVPRSNSAENVSPTQQRQTPPSKRHYGTIPRQHGAQVLQQIHQQLRQHQVDASIPPGPQPSSLETTKSSPASTTTTTTTTASISLSPSTNPSSTPQSFQHPSLDNFRSPRTKSSGVSFGKGFFKLKNGKRSSSAPELALPEYAVHPNGRETPRSTLSRSRESPQSMLSLPQGSPSISSKSEPKERKGIKKIFGKLKRSGSQSMDLVGGEFSRNRLRATAGPRLGWSEGTGPDNIASDIPFAQWDTDMVANWLHRIGLNMYVNECKRWVKNGDHLLKASKNDLEKELGIKNPFHHKKLQLAFQSLGSKNGDIAEAAGKLDYQWVTRWLDDIGLPQYKDTFLEARIDGRMLHHLTVEDLFNLKVFNQLHHISVKRGIQVLRENSFEPFCLKRRSLPDESKAYDSREVALWSNHRVMEWLRTVDLSEYAPNLRGSGVHGSLMVYEPRFTAELLATLLNIPPNKTLLRRHLITHFRQVVGLELMQKKREAEGQAGYVPLTPSAKVKAVRRGHFTLKKKRKTNELVFEDYVCPIDIPEKPSKSLDGESGHRNDDSTSQQEHKDQKTAHEIGAVSKDISSLTSMLKNENLMATMTTTNV